MDFDEYVVARRVPLVRAAVLLGVDDARAPVVVDGVLTRCARTIEREADPDPRVHAALLAALPKQPARSASTPRTDADDEPGHRVRRALAGLDPSARATVVLGFHADLTPHETAGALGCTPAHVAALEREAVRVLAPEAGPAAMRQLLMQAAETITAPLLPPLRRPPRRVRPSAVAGVAAAVIAVLVTGLLASDDGADGRQVPLLYGFGVGSATSALTERGLVVAERMSPSCDPVGKVIGTDPPTGAPVEAGDTVTLLTSYPAEDDCSARFEERTAAWEFVDFAAGRGPAPPFAAQVTVVVNGRRSTLTGAQALDGSLWGKRSALSLVSAALRTVSAVPDSVYVRTPQLSAEFRQPPAVTCGLARPSEVGRRRALSVTLSPEGGAGAWCPTTADLYRRSGRIDTVVVYAAP